MSFKIPTVRDAKHLKFIRELPCAVCLQSPCDAAHIRAGCYSMGMKPGDNLVVPLSHDCHMLQHKVSEAKFWPNLFEAKQLAQFLYDNTGNREMAVNAIVKFRNRNQRQSA